MIFEKNQPMVRTNWFFDFWKPLVKNIHVYTQPYSTVIGCKMERTAQQWRLLQSILPKKIVVMTTHNSVNEGDKWNAQWTTLTVHHSLEVSDFDWWGYGMKLYRFLYRQTLTSVVRIEWRCIHSMESWCTNHAASVLQKPFAFHTVSNREFYVIFLCLIGIDPLSHGSSW